MKATKLFDIELTIGFMGEQNQFFTGFTQVEYDDGVADRLCAMTEIKLSPKSAELVNAVKAAATAISYFTGFGKNLFDNRK